MKKDIDFRTLKLIFTDICIFSSHRIQINNIKVSGKRKRYRNSFMPLCSGVPHVRSVRKDAMKRQRYFVRVYTAQVMPTFTIANYIVKK